MRAADVSSRKAESHLVSKMAASPPTTHITPTAIMILSVHRAEGSTHLCTPPAYDCRRFRSHARLRLGRHLGALGCLSARTRERER
jgi:hypothetical protein